MLQSNLRNSFYNACMGRCLVCLLILIGFQLDAWAESRPKLLVLSSANQPSSFMEVCLAGLQQGFEKHRLQCDLMIETLGIETSLDPEFETETWKRILSQRYQHSSVDAVVCIGDAALEMWIDLRETIQRDLPVVFLGVQNQPRSYLLNHSEVSGVYEQPDAAAVARLAANLFPDYKRLVAISNPNTYPEQSHTATKESLKSKTSRFEIDFQEVTSSHELANLVASSDPKDLFLILSRNLIEKPDWWKNQNDAPAYPIRPIFTIWEHQLGRGILGGKTIPAHQQGLMAANLLNMALRSQSHEISSFVEAAPSAYTFDHVLIKRWQIERHALPVGSRIINQPPIPWFKQQRFVWAVAAFLGVQITLIIFLIFLWLTRKNKQLELERQTNLLRTLIDNLPQDIFIKDRQSRFVLANRKILHNKNIQSNDEIVGLSDYQFCKKEEADQHYATEQEIMSSGVPMLRKEIEYINKQGATAWFLSTKIPFKNDHDEVIGIFGINEDITDYKNLLNALKISEDRLSNALASVNEGIYDLDFFTGNFFTSAKCKEMLGYLEEDIAPGFQAWMELVHPSDKSQVEEKLKQHLNGETDRFDVQMRMRTSRGTYKWIHNQGKVIARDQAGHPLRMMGTHQDITAIKEAEVIQQRQHENERMLELQSHKNRSLQVMASGIAHLFNNLLMAMMGHMEIIKRRLEPRSNLWEHLQDAEEAAQRAASLSRVMLTYVGQSEYEPNRLNPHTILQHLKQQCADSLPDNQLLTITAPESLPPVYGDEKRLIEALQQLVKNASEAYFQKPGTIDVVVEKDTVDESISTMVHDGKVERGEYLKISVSDSGVGVNADTLERVFDPFFSTKFTGRGLGLPLVCGVVRLHKGFVTAHSTPNKGSEFSIYLPLNPLGEKGRDEQEVVVLCSTRETSELLICQLEGLRKKPLCCSGIDDLPGLLRNNPHIKVVFIDQNDVDQAFLEKWSYHEDQLASIQIVLLAEEFSHTPPTGWLKQLAPNWVLPKPFLIRDIEKIFDRSNGESLSDQLG